MSERTNCDTCKIFLTENNKSFHPWYCKKCAASNKRKILNKMADLGYRIVHSWEQERCINCAGWNPRLHEYCDVLNTSVVRQAVCDAFDPIPPVKCDEDQEGLYERLLDGAEKMLAGE